MSVFKSPVIVIACYVLALTCAASVNNTPKSNIVHLDSKQSQTEFLKRYGYMGEKCPDEKLQKLSKSDQDRAFKTGVTMYQKFYNLEITGEINEETRNHMEKPRCGCPDIVNTHQVDDLLSNSTRSKRYAILYGGRWKKDSLTYRVSKNIYSRQHSSEIYSYQVDSLLVRAFNEWAKITPLQISRTPNFPDIDIRFEERYHGDSDPFDGYSGVLAHASPPVGGGDIHFDNEEIWTHNNPAHYGTSFFLVAVHEIGHALGLDHSNIYDSIMYAQYSYEDESTFELHSDDVAGIQYLYGQNTSPTTKSTSSTSASSTTPNTSQTSSTSASSTSSTSSSVSSTSSATPSDASNFCELSSIDAAFSDKDGYGYFFKGAYVGVVRNALLPGYPKLISSEFPGLPSDLDAALNLPTLLSRECWWFRGRRYCSLYYTVVESARTYFFKGDTYYMYYNNQFWASGTISSRFPGIPTPIDAATTVFGQYLYFIKGNQMWKMNRATKTISSTVLQPTDFGLPSSIDAAFVQAYGGYRLNYFFKDHQYYRITSGTNYVDQANPSYPRPIKTWWFGCSSNLVALQDADNDVEPHAFNQSETAFEVFVDKDGELITDFEIGTEEQRKEAMADSGSSPSYTRSCTTIINIWTILVVLLNKWIV